MNDYEYLLSIGGSNGIKPLDTITDSNGYSNIFTPRIQSTNFNGSLSLTNTSIVAGSVLAGWKIYLSSDRSSILTTTPSSGDEDYLVVKKIDGSTSSYVIFTVVIDGVQVAMPEILKTTTIPASREDWSGKIIGDTGWLITSEGNAIFSNVAVRGNITADSGHIGTNPYKWYIGNELNDNEGHGVIATWDHSTEYPNAGQYGVEIDSEGYFEAYAPIDIDPATPDVFTVTAVSRVLVGARYYYRYTTSIAHNIQPGQAVFISGLSRYNNSSVSSEPAPVYATTSNTFDIDTTYILDSYTTNISAQSGSVRKAQRIFGFSAGGGDAILDADGNSFTPSGLYYATSSKKLGTYIPSSGKIIFRGIKSADDSLTSMYIEIDPDATDVYEYYDANLFAYYISPGTFTIRNSSVGMTFDNNEIQGFSATIAGGIEYKTGNAITINALGGNVNLGKTGGSQDINIHGSPVYINNNVNDGNIYLGAGTSTSDNNTIYSQGIYWQTSTSGSSVTISASSPYALQRSTSSSERYKNSISTDLSGDLDPNKILDINVVKFKYNEGYLTENDQNDNKFIIGFIAEDVNEKYPIAVDKLDDGTPENWNVRFLVPAMLKIIQEQQIRINSLEKRLAILEG